MLASSQPFTPNRTRSLARRIAVVCASAASIPRVARHVRAALRALSCTLVVALPLAGCAGAPVQEMSDTRQTIRAAEHAGADAAAPSQLAEAREGLRRAEDSLRQRDYRAARREAETAHAKAVEALKVASAGQPAGVR
jgi:hypothetical protein